MRTTLARTRRAGPAILLLLAMTGCARSAVAATASGASSRVVIVDVPAPALSGNRVGTPDTQRAAVYLPAGYDEDATRRYPVVYLLHGIFDSHETWLEWADVPALLDRLIASGDMPASIVVMPDGGNRYGGGFYRDSPTTGGWGTFIARDLVGFVDASFRTRAHAHARAIVGHSMGGYGAIHLPMEHPGVFSVAYAMSPCCLAPVEDLGFGNTSWVQAASLESLAQLEEAVERRDFYVVAAMGVASAFSPDTTNAPFFVDLPFDVVRGETVLDEDAWLAYVERFPVARADDRRDRLAGLRALGMDYGTGDQFMHIPAATLAFSQRLGELRVPHTLDVYDGDHRERIVERLETVVLPWVGSALRVAP